MDRVVVGGAGRKTELWRDRIDAWSRSGLSQIEFCKREKLNRSAFTYWKRKLTGNDSKEEENRLFEIPFRPSVHRTFDIRITLRNGVRVAVGEECSAERLRDIVQMLESVRCS